MNLASDSSYIADLWPYLWIVMIVLLILWVIHKIRKGKWK